MGTVALSLKVINWDKLFEIYSLYFLNQLVFFGNIEVDFCWFCPGKLSPDKNLFFQVPGIPGDCPSMPLVVKNMVATPFTPGGGTTRRVSLNLRAFLEL